MSKGVSPLELAAAYGTIANNGVYVEPKLYTKIEDRNGEVVLEKKSEVRDVMSKQNAYILTDMLKTVTVGSEGTGRAARLTNIDVAAKTGTTSDDKDRWFTAYTPYYVGAVWFGYDKPKYINVSTNPGTKVWKAIMEKVHEDLPAAKFEKPAGVIEVEVCRDSGLIATEDCKKDLRGTRVITEIFNSKNGSVPKEYCEIHEFATVCPDSFKLANPTCIRTVGTIQISRINRHYAEGQPTINPTDYDYETPTTYCEFHYCPKDENGNWIYDYNPIPETPWENSESGEYTNSNENNQNEDLTNENMSNGDASNNNASDDNTSNNDENSKYR